MSQNEINPLQNPIHSTLVKCLVAKLNSASFQNTDVGNSMRLVHLFGDLIRYCPQKKSWFLWSGSRWKKDQHNQITKLAKLTTEVMIQQAAGMPETKLRDERMQFAFWSQHVQRIQAMVKLAKSVSRLIVNATNLDSDPMLLGVANGVVDLETGEFRQADRKDLITKSAGTAFQQSAKAPRFEKFIAEITGGDQELAAYLQELCGYFLTGLTSAQQIYIPFGSGANGKSVFFELIRALMGDYAKTVSPEAFMAQNNNGGATPELASLTGARFVLASEPEDGQRLAEALVKRVTGQDTITARGLYQQPFEYVPQFKVVMVTNHKPVIRGTGHSIWRRIRLIPFDQVFTKEQRNPNLIDELKAELPGILNWAVEGLKRYLLDGLQTPDRLEQLVAVYKTDMDYLGEWIEDCLVEGPQCKAKISDLYASYQEWCSLGGQKQMSKKALTQKLVDRGYKKIRTSGARMFEGIGVKQKAAAVPLHSIRKRAG